MLHRNLSFRINKHNLLLTFLFPGKHGQYKLSNDPHDNISSILSLLFDAIQHESHVNTGVQFLSDDSTFHGVKRLQ